MTVTMLFLKFVFRLIDTKNEAKGNTGGVDQTGSAGNPGSAQLLKL